MSRDWEYEWMSDRLTDQWLNSKNSNLGWNMPWWIRTGLGQHMKFARVKGKRVEFDLDAWDNSTMRTMLKKGTAIPLKKMFMAETVKYVWGHNLQAGSVVGWLLGPGNRGKTKNALTNYLKAMVGAIEEAEAEFKKQRRNDPTWPLSHDRQPGPPRFQLGTTDRGNTADCPRGAGRPRLHF